MPQPAGRQNGTVMRAPTDTMRFTTMGVRQVLTPPMWFLDSLTRKPTPETVKQGTVFPLLLFFLPHF